jgi:hypothetical protein
LLLEPILSESVNGQAFTIRGLDLLEKLAEEPDIILNKHIYETFADVKRLIYGGRHFAGVYEKYMAVAGAMTAQGFLKPGNGGLTNKGIVTLEVYASELSA